MSDAPKRHRGDLNRRRRLLSIYSGSVPIHKGLIMRVVYDARTGHVQLKVHASKPREPRGEAQCLSWRKTSSCAVHAHGRVKWHQRVIKVPPGGSRWGTRNPRAAEA